MKYEWNKFCYIITSCTDYGRNHSSCLYLMVWNILCDLVTFLTYFCIRTELYSSLLDIFKIGNMAILFELFDREIKWTISSCKWSIMLMNYLCLKKWCVVDLRDASLIFLKAVKMCSGKVWVDQFALPMDKDKSMNICFTIWIKPDHRFILISRIRNSIPYSI